jgi:DNA polymerase-3 subunit alpha
MSFCPVHNHSEYSQFDGLSTTQEIADRCKELGYPAVGLSDHGTVAGHLDFARTMEKNGIKPIFACELYHGVNETPKGQKRDQAHFLAGALNDEGLRNLWRLVNDSANNFFHVPRINWDILDRYSEGLFATSACIQGLVSQGVLNNDLSALNQYLEIFGENFFIELHTYPTDDQKTLNLELAELAKERGIPTIVATDAHYAHPDQYEAHDAYMAAKVKQTIYLDPADRKMWHPKALYIQSQDDIRKHLSYLPDSLIDESMRNSVALAERVSATLPKIKRHLPVFVPKNCPWFDAEGKSVAQMFFALVEEGIQNRYGDNPPSEVLGRAAQEMRVFIDAGLEHYFLQAWDFCQFCDENGIKRGPGRGSAAGAIVAYTLGITDIDPMKYGLIFERFYNAGREQGFPDIDNDFPAKDRQKVKEYLETRWGQDKVRTIGTITRMKPKAACDATYQALGVEWKEKEELKAIISKVPDIDILGPDSVGWTEATDPGKTVYVLESVGAEIIAWVESKAVPRQQKIVRWLNLLEVICSRVQHYGVHASGVVVADVDLAAELPCRWSPDKKTPVTEFPMTEVDKRQFVKQDLLGLRNLDTLAEWERLSGKQVNWSGLEHREEIDPAMWEYLDKGLTLGVFQIEKGYARQLCKEFQPRSVEDLAIIVALNRPGPIRSGAPDSFIARRHGTEDVTYDHPILEDILEETYGWFLYQEQVIQFFGKLGYDLSEADAVRKILGKKKPEAMEALYHGKGEWEGRGWLDIAAPQLGGAAQTIWDKLEGFAAYSFNKSHAVAYATIAYRTLVAKFLDPQAFVVACLRTNPDDAGDYVTEGRRMGISVLAPEIDRSDVDVSVVDEDVVFGFANIKGIGKTTAAYALSLRKKRDLSSPEKFLEALEKEQEEWKNRSEGNKGRSPRQKFRANLVHTMVDAGVWDRYNERSLTLVERQKLEKELLQVVLTDNTAEILENNSDTLEQCHRFVDLGNGNGSFRLPGVVASVSEKRTKKERKAMGIVRIEYEGEDAEFVVFPEHWRSYGFLFKDRTAGVFEIAKTDRGLHFKGGVKLT